MKQRDPAAKVLIFSQFTSMLDILHYRLTQVLIDSVAPAGSCVAARVVDETCCWFAVHGAPACLAAVGPGQLPDQHMILFATSWPTERLSKFNREHVRAGGHPVRGAQGQHDNGAAGPDDRCLHK